MIIGLVNYYKDMWPIRSHLLQHLTALTSSKARFKWTDVEQKAFYDIKLTVAHDSLLSYPDFNKSFDIHKDARYLQLGAVISQEVKLIASHICKITGLQMR